MEIRLIPATSNSSILLEKLCREAYELVFSSHWVKNGMKLYLDSQFSQQQLLEDINHKDKKYYFIQKKGKNVGFVKMNFASAELFSPIPNCELEKLYILPSFARQGIGEEVMNVLIQKAKKRKKKLLFLLVLDTNVSAISFYQKLGFTKHSATQLEIPFFKDHLRGMDRICLAL